MNRHLKLRSEALEARNMMAAGALSFSAGGLLASGIMAGYSADGRGNNEDNPDWGSAGVNLLRIAPAEYGDGIFTPAGADRPSPREISNVLVDQGDEDIISDRSLSAMIYVWGQFIDHDLDLTPTGTSEAFDIPVPSGDPSFDPDGYGDRVLSFTRSVFDPASGDTTPREQTNVVTAWLDGSMIYGSDPETALALRTREDGRLKTGPDRSLPLNNAATFPDGALAMDNNGAGPDDEVFAAGDVRANENIELTALHTLFVREHNYWAGKIAARRSALTDDQVYQQARAIVIAELQAITYNEWLPTFLGSRAIDRYAGYDPTVNPGIANEFSTAGFRVGHTLLGDDVEFLDNRGREVAEGVALSDAFFNPQLFTERGIDSIIKYLASDPASEVDSTIVNSVRDLLFGPPGSSGFDLASLNIQRGRDHGIAHYNAVRVAYGLAPVTRFSQITSNREVQARLDELYDSVDDIDLWVGALAEDHVRGGSVGPLLREIISDQFERVRDGDRFWYQNVLTGRALREANNTSLNDIIRRNTGISNLQDNSFVFRAEIYGTIYAEGAYTGSQLINALARGLAGLAGQSVELVDDEGEVVASATTDRRGRYSFDVADGLRTGQYKIRVERASGQDYVYSRTINITRGDQAISANIGLRLARPRWQSAAIDRLS